MAADYEKMLRFMLGYLLDNEGTDGLSYRGADESHKELTAEENAELTRIRDEVRESYGWSGDPYYPQR